jgi:hypothetical protein
MNGMLQPAGSLASSMTNLSSLQLGPAAGSQHGRAANTMSSTGGSKGAAAKNSTASTTGAAARGPGSHYVSPYGQQRRQ